MSLLVQAPVWGAQHTAFDAQPPHQQSTVAMASGWDGRHGHSQLAACHSRVEPHAARGQWGVLGSWAPEATGASMAVLLLVFTPLHRPFGFLGLPPRYPGFHGSGGLLGLL